MAEQSINIPQVIVFLVVTFLAVRWYFSKPTTTRPSTEISRLIQDRADQLSQMFPQLDRRELGWDLRNNGGNVQATTERALSGRGFERPPEWFQLRAPRRIATPAQSTAATAKPTHPDLITRYNLSSKLSQANEPTSEESPKGKAWSSDRNERQANLQRRREEMILAARRKLQQQESSKASETAA